MIPIAGYAPDLDPTTPGILTDCTSLIPTLKGYAGAPTASSIGADALAAACQGAAVCVDLDDTVRVFAGTSTKLYELSGTSWTDVARVGDYSLGTDIRWCFSQFGNIGLAVSKPTTLQASNTGDFADVAGAPKATIVETVGQFVFLADTNETTYGDSPDRWWCCAKGDYTDWSPDIATECATGRLTSTPGPIKAAKRFGDAMVLYKERAMFLGVYVGAPQVWDFREIPGEIGALGEYAVVNVGTSDNPLHIFMAADDFYQFNGSRPVKIGTPVREAVYGQMNRNLAYLSIAQHDPTKALIRFYYCSTGQPVLDKCVVYNYKTGKWGRDDRTIEMAFQYVSGGITYATLGNLYSTYNDLPAISYDSSFWTARTPIPTVFNTSHQILTLTGQATTSSMTSGDMGDEQRFSMLNRVIPRWLTKPTTASMINYYRDNLGDSLTTDQTTTIDARGRFDVMREARWHRIRMDFTGPTEITGFTPELVPGGYE